MSDLTTTLTERGKRILNFHYWKEEEQYAEVVERIHNIREALMTADRDTRLTVYERAYVYAVLTANAPLTAADEAYQRWLDGESIETVVREGRHTNSKIEQLREGLSGFEKKISPADECFVSGDFDEAAEEIRRNLPGLARAKASFMVGMITGQTACVDTHTTDFLDAHLENPDEVRSSKRGYTSRESYKAGTKALSAAIPGVPRLVAQLIVFDARRGTVTDHSLFLASIESVLE